MYTDMIKLYHLKAWGSMAKNCGIFPVEILFLLYCFEQEQEAKARKKVARNNEVLGVLNAGVSGNQIANEFNLSYTGARKICAFANFSVSTA